MFALYNQPSARRLGSDGDVLFGRDLKSLDQVVLVRSQKKVVGGRRLQGGNTTSIINAQVIIQGRLLAVAATYRAANLKDNKARWVTWSVRG